MKNAFMTIVVAGIATMITVPFLSALGPSARLINLPLLLIVVLVMNFRDREAFIAAITTGLLIDILSASPTGSHVIIWVIATVSIAALFARVFTHLSVLAYLGMNTVAFIILNLLGLLVAIVRVSFGNLPGITFPDLPSIITFMRGAFMHISVALILLVIVRIAKRATAPFIFLRRV